MAYSVSVCIPTYCRPELVREAVVSALDQGYPALEVLVSDDSPDDRTEKCLAGLVAGRRIRYIRNKPPLRQAGNVNQLFQQAAGDLLILLHDDDLLVPGAIDNLAACFEQHPSIDAAFGKQYLINEAGAIDEVASIELNQLYYRTASQAGCQPQPLLSALVAQFPNDGFMVRTAIAQAVGYRDAPTVGDACDLDFGLRLAAASKSFYFLNKYTAKYRTTEESITAHNNYTNLTFNLLRNVRLPAELEPVRLKQLQKYATPAVNCWLEVGDRQSATRIYWSSGYGWANRLSIKGAAQAALLLCPPTLSKRLVGTLRWLRDGLVSSLSLRPLHPKRALPEEV